MYRLLTAVSLAVLLMVASVQGETVLFDDFEEGVRGDIWKKWPAGPEEVIETLQTDSSVNHTPDGEQSARAYESDPAGYCSYADFGATAGEVVAETWVFDPFDDVGTDFDRPVSIMLALIGEAEEPDQYTDYLQLGVISWYDPQGKTQKYYARTKYNDDRGLGFIPTGVFRRQGWIHLKIVADAYVDGGAVRFYIDDQEVASSFRDGQADLQYVRLGVNFKTYDNIWYDDVKVDVDDQAACHEVRFDVDGDLDVDQEDFGTYQRCFTGPFGAYGLPACRCVDADVNGRVDLDDLAAFQNCASGPAIPANPDCDDALPPP